MRQNENHLLCWRRARPVHRQPSRCCSPAPSSSPSPSGREPDRKIKIDLSDALEAPPPAAPPTAPLPISGLVPTNVTITDVPGLVLSYASGAWLLLPPCSSSPTCACPSRMASRAASSRRRAVRYSSTASPSSSISSHYSRTSPPSSPRRRHVSRLLLLLAFLLFPLAEFFLKHFALACFPSNRILTLTIGGLSELLQAVIFSYFTGYNPTAIGLFGRVAIIQLVNIFFEYRAELEGVPSEASSTTVAQRGGILLKSTLNDGLGFFTVVSAIAAMLTVWAWLAVIVPSWTTIVITVGAWLLSSSLVFRGKGAQIGRTLEALGAMIGIVGSLLCFTTELFIAREWSWIVAQVGSQALAVAEHTAYVFVIAWLILLSSMGNDRFLGRPRGEETFVLPFDVMSSPSIVVLYRLSAVGRLSATFGVACLIATADALVFVPLAVGLHWWTPTLWVLGAAVPLCMLPCCQGQPSDVDDAEAKALADEAEAEVRRGAEGEGEGD